MRVPCGKILSSQFGEGIHTYDIGSKCKLILFWTGNSISIFTRKKYFDRTIQFKR